MREVLENLKSNQVLYHQNVIDLKECIRKNYPQYTAKRTAELFSAAIHKIIDKNITHFDKDIQTDIKKHLLQEVVKKDVFDINAYDVFEACTALKISDDRYFENLTDWLNHNQNVHFSKDEVMKLSLNLEGYEEDVISTLAFEENQSITQPITPSFSFLKAFKKRNAQIFVAAAMIIGLFAIISNFYHVSIKQEALLAAQAEKLLTAEKDTFLTAKNLSMSKIQSDISLQKNLQYKEINKEALYNWLIERNSILAEQPYFNSIIDVAKEFNINPLLLFAITGQEQSFVPKSNPKASSIANNPFNVYGSWEEFNTDIKDTSKIAARTILTLSKDCPSDKDPIKWINQKYAEDPNWHLGVSQIFAQLEETAGH